MVARCHRGRPIGGIGRSGGCLLVEPGIAAQSLEQRVNVLGQAAVDRRLSQSFWRLRAGLVDQIVGFIDKGKRFVLDAVAGFPFPKRASRAGGFIELICAIRGSGDWVTEGIVSQGVGVRKLYRLATSPC